LTELLAQQPVLIADYQVAPLGSDPIACSGGLLVDIALARPASNQTTPHLIPRALAKCRTVWFTGW